MKYTATIRVDLTAETPEARDFLLAGIVRDAGNPHRMAFLNVGDGQVQKARVERGVLSRVRQAPKRKR
jgi:hypothetical protein